MYPFRAKFMSCNVRTEGGSGSGMLARCVRCHRMYEEDREAECVFHPGRYQGGLSAKPPHGPVGWTCCSATSEKATGCKMVSAHLRCEATAQALDSFGPADEGMRRRKDARGVVPVIDAPPVAKKGVPSEAVSYSVCVGDTLASVALKHGMRVDQIKRWNKLLSPNIYAGQQLFVAPPQPPTAEQLRAEALRRIMRRAACGKEEAACYLDEAEGDAERALAGLRDAADEEDWLRVERETSASSLNSATAAATALATATLGLSTLTATIFPMK